MRFYPHNSICEVGGVKNIEQDGGLLFGYEKNCEALIHDQKGCLLLH